MAKDKATKLPVNGPNAMALAPIIAQADDYLQASTADSTRRAYRSDWEHFATWCGTHGLPALPAHPKTVRLYLADHATILKPATLERRLAVISKAHQAAGHESPTRTAEVRDTLKGIKRTVGVSQNRKTAIRASQLREVAPKLSDGSMQSLRDRAILLVGYAGAFRRSELVSLDVADVSFSPEGARIVLRNSKTDQEGKGTLKGIGYGLKAQTCPVRALHAWLDVSKIVEGPIFRPITKSDKVRPVRLSSKAVSLILKRLAPAFGLDPAQVSGHSLRAGFVTDQYASGTAETVIMQQTGHKSRAVLGIYRREADTFAFNFTAAAGL